MGRPERPVTMRTRQSAALAQYLRVLRQRSGRTYAELGRSTGMTPSRLSRAASGDSVPSLAVVEQYAKGCGADKQEMAELRKLWRAARGGRAPALAVERPMHITLIDTPKDLWTAMVHLHRKLGCPPLRELERRAGGHGQLPRSTLNLVLRGLAQPSRDLLEHFVRACDVPPAEINRWLEAWDRVHTPRSVVMQDPELRRFMRLLRHSGTTEAAIRRALYPAPMAAPRLAEAFRSASGYQQVPLPGQTQLFVY
ncbi:hypothetical protein GCM10009760_61470 [Kitasatospora kazusensis]|uniref:HTH cro/C1-type domain-containing protein n=1 Tax=Kitasatospora kazusensis TaxID=407974 RepID=A0ABN3ABS6_9ACTN